MHHSLDIFRESPNGRSTPSMTPPGPLLSWQSMAAFALTYTACELVHPAGMAGL